MAQLVKNPPAMWETWVRALAREDPLEKGTTIHYSCLENPVDRGAWWATNPLPWGCKELDTPERLSTRGGKSRTPRPWLSSPVSRASVPCSPCASSQVRRPHHSVPCCSPPAGSRGWAPSAAPAGPHFLPRPSRRPVEAWLSCVHSRDLAGIPARAAGSRCFR